MTASALREASDGVAVAAPVMEVFPSIQGEGLYAGRPQVFVRLRGCPLRCRYCDTPGSWEVPDGVRTPLARVGGGSAARREPAWATPFRVATWVRECEGAAPRPVSVTGGEPLLWPEFVRALAPLLGERRLHLETAGAHPEALAQVLDAVDHVSLDLKAAVDLEPPAGPEPAAGLPRDAEEWRDVRRRVLPLLRGRDACAKLVVTGSGDAASYEELIEDVWELAPELEVILQPATPVAGVRAPRTGALVELAERALELELNVRLLPQLHRTLGLA